MSFSNESPQHTFRRPLCGVALAVAVIVAAPSLMALDAPNRPASVRTRASTSRAATAQPKGHTPALYLAMIGPTPLRFANTSPALPPEPVMPKPVLPVDELPAAQDPAHARNPADTTSGGSSSSSSANTPNGTPTDMNASEQTGKTPLRIIPDDLRKEVRPEDVLPFFQLPSGADGVGLELPLSLPASRAPAAQPASSATYRQQ